MKENTKRPQDLISNYCEEIHKLKRINLTAIRKEMSRMNGLSSEVIRKYDDEIGGNKPEWLLMGCIAVGLEYKLPADRIKEFVDSCIQSFKDYCGYDVRFDRLFEEPNELNTTEKREKIKRLYVRRCSRTNWILFCRKVRNVFYILQARIKAELLPV